MRSFAPLTAVAALMALAASACRPSTATVDFPANERGTEILISRHDGTVDAFAYSLDGSAIRTPIAASLGADAEVEALIYRRPIAAVLVDRMPMSDARIHLVADDGANTEPLPRPDATYALSIHSGAPGAWTMETAESDAARALRILRRDLSRCIGPDRCLVDDMNAPLDPTCMSPCPEIAAPQLPILPALPEMPSIAPCPEGWSESPGDREHPTLCLPSLGPACPIGQVRLPDESECRTVGPDCPSDLWPAGVQANETTFVDSGAAPGGNGTKDHPLSTIGEATMAGHPTIAVRSGSYAESVTLQSGVALIGACSAGTTIAAPTAATPAVVAVNGRGVSISNLRITGGIVAVDVAQNASAALHGVIADGSSVIAVRSLGELRADEAIFASSEFGLLVDSNATADLDHVLVESNQIAGIEIDGGRASVHRSRIARNGADQPTQNGGGLVLTGGLLEVTESVLEDNQHGGFILTGQTSTATLASIAVFGTKAIRSNFGNQSTIAVLDHARVTLERALLQNNQARAFSVDTATISIADVDIEDQLSNEMNGFCGQVGAAHDGAIYAKRMRASHVVGAGIHLSGSASAMLEDIEISDVSGCGLNDGLSAIDGANLIVRRAHLRRILERAIDLDGVIPNQGARASADVEDLTVEGNPSCGTSTAPSTRPCHDSLHWKGVFASAETQLTITRAYLAAVNDAGVAVLGSASAIITDLTVVGASDDAVRIASDFNIPNRALTLDRVRIADARGGISAFRSSAVELRDVSIATSSRGIDAQPGGTLRLTTFEIARCGAGVSVETTGSLDIFDGRLSNNGTGASVAKGFDRTRLLHHVLFDDADPEFVEQ